MNKDTIEEELSSEVIAQIDLALEAANLKLDSFKCGKPRPFATSEGTKGTDSFCQLLLKKLGARTLDFPDVTKALDNVQSAEKLFKAYADNKEILIGDHGVNTVPPDLQDLTLNLDMSSTREGRFFLTRPDETISRVSGESYLSICQIHPTLAYKKARKVIPEYHPRKASGVFEVINNGETECIYNTHTPAKWQKYQNSKNIPDSLPPLFEKLVNHLFPIPAEREYFYCWLYYSLFNRAFVYLVLCGKPGTGKNRLKLVLRALHGHSNTADGKRSTLTERFNSQLSNATLVWFDELRYTEKMENTLKEIQNDTISVERKGVDTTLSTKIHASLVISNNKPSDNFITFDARKFAPLKVNSKGLKSSMTSKEIDELTMKVEDESSDSFDPMFLAQIAKWIKKHGLSKKWPHLEYKGPMFWRLAHSSMTPWQKILISTLLNPETYSTRFGDMWDGKRLCWSKLQKKLTRGQEGGSRLQDSSTVKDFLSIFRDEKGKILFSTSPIPGREILGDFYITPLDPVLTQSASRGIGFIRTGNGKMSHVPNEETSTSNTNKMRVDYEDL